MKQKITVLGSTGSIGTNTLDVVARHPDQYEIFALSDNIAVMYEGRIMGVLPIAEASREKVGLWMSGVEAPCA